MYDHCITVPIQKTEKYSIFSDMAIRERLGINNGKLTPNGHLVGFWSGSRHLVNTPDFDENWVCTC